MEDNMELAKYFGLGMIVLLPFAIYGLLLVDKIIMKLHDSFLSEWDSAGRPSGIFHNPPNIDDIQPAISMLKNITAWLFVTPEWIKGDANLASSLIRLRVCVIAWNAGIVALLVIIFMSFKEILLQTF